MSIQQRTIGEICSDLLAEAVRIGYSKRYVWEHMSKYLSIIHGYYRNHHICIFSIEATDACLTSYRIKYEQGLVTRKFLMRLSATVRRLEEYALTGRLSIVTHHKQTPEPLPPHFESILDRFIHHANYKENTVNDVDWVVRKYLRFFNDEGHASLADVSMEDVRSYIMKTAMEVKTSTLHDIFLYLRHFHLFLKQETIPAPDAEGIFSYTIHREMPIQGYITDEELRKILSVIDTTTESGCRNMAIILLAVTTGIRACDVIRLKLTDIDWRKGEISFSQDKTDKMVSLPLLPEVGEALKQYILNFRPAVSECKEVFLRCSPPKTAITNATSIADMLILYQQKAGVERKPFDGKGFHGLRRHLAKNLLDTGTPPETIAQILGHSQVQSVQQYLVLNTKQLKNCAIDFSGIEVERGELI